MYFTGSKPTALCKNLAALVVSLLRQFASLTWFVCCRGEEPDEQGIDTLGKPSWHINESFVPSKRLVDDQVDTAVVSDSSVSLPARGLVHGEKGEEGGGEGKKRFEIVRGSM